MLEGFTVLVSTAMSFVLIMSAVAYARTANHSEELRSQINSGNAKNVILMIGDDMDDSAITKGNCLSSIV